MASQSKKFIVKNGLQVQGGVTSDSDILVEGQVVATEDLNTSTDISARSVTATGAVSADSFVGVLDATNLIGTIDSNLIPQIDASKVANLPTLTDSSVIQGMIDSNLANEITFGGNINLADDATINPDGSKALIINPVGTNSSVVHIGPGTPDTSGQQLYVADSDNGVTIRAGKAGANTNIQIGDQLNNALIATQSLNGNFSFQNNFLNGSGTEIANIGESGNHSFYVNDPSLTKKRFKVQSSTSAQTDLNHAVFEINGLSGDASMLFGQSSGNQDNWLLGYDASTASFKLGYYGSYSTDANFANVNFDAFEILPTGAVTYNSPMHFKDSAKVDGTLLVNGQATFTDEVNIFDSANGEEVAHFSGDPDQGLIIHSHAHATDGGFRFVIHDTADSDYLVISRPGGISVENRRIRNVATPVEFTDGANKQYVDAVASGLAIKDAVRAATDGALVGTNDITAIDYDSGTLGVGAFIQITGTQALDVLDGVTLVTNDRLIVKNETDQRINGIYTWDSAHRITRSTDFDEPSEIGGGEFVFVQEGTENGNIGFANNNTVNVVGDSAIAWIQFSAAGQVDAGDGLSKTGSRLDVDLAGTPGLEFDTGRLRVKVDNSTIERAVGGLQIKASSITTDEISISGGTGITVQNLLDNAGHTTDNITSEGSTNQWFTTARANTAIDNRVDADFVEAIRPAETIMTLTGDGSNYSFTGDGFASAQTDPDLYVQKGKTYKFEVQAGHPLEIRTSSGGSAYSDGVTNNGGSGDVIWTVPMNAPDQLVYQCTVHSGMVGNIYVGAPIGTDFGTDVTIFQADSSPRLGIGTTSPTEEIDIIGNPPTIRMYDKDGADEVTMTMDGGVFTVRNPNGIQTQFYTGTQKTLLIDDTHVGVGDPVGVNTATPFHVHKINPNNQAAAVFKNPNNADGVISIEATNSKWIVGGDYSRSNAFVLSHRVTGDPDHSTALFQLSTSGDLTLGGTTTMDAATFTDGNVVAFNMANGTAPFTVQSSTVVQNLNADLLDGNQGSYYRIDILDSDGTILNA